MSKRIDRRKPHVTTDHEADAAYIYLVGMSRGIARTIEARRDVYLDFDEAGRLIGIELLGLNLLHPSLGPVVRLDRPKRKGKQAT